MKIEEDNFYERMRKEVILKPEDASLKQEGHERHSRGEDIDEVSTGDEIYDTHIYVYTHRLSVIVIPTIRLIPVQGRRYTMCI